MLRIFEMLYLGLRKEGQEHDQSIDAQMRFVPEPWYVFCLKDNCIRLQRIFRYIDTSHKNNINAYAWYSIT